MIYLTTGANGAGKTLLTLRDVRDQQLKENRPVFYNGFEIKPEIADEFGWKPFDPKKWQDLPDGSICVMDECQNEFPKRGSSAAVPDYINAVAQFRRKRGFDFWLISPHPSLIDNFILKLIASPSWHRHLKRAFGADVVSEIKFGTPDLQCEKDGAGKRGVVAMRTYPKEVYNWYRSASLHTGKKKIPFKLWVAIGAFFAVPAMLYGGYSVMRSNAERMAAGPAGINAQGGSSGGSMRAAPKGPVSVSEYVSMREPRLRDFPHTAPAYDEITQPVRAPYPAACVSDEKRCECWTQQATKLRVSEGVCRQIVAQGYFVDFKLEEPQRQQQYHVQYQQQPQQQYQVQSRQSSADDENRDGFEARLAARNATVTSIFGR